MTDRVVSRMGNLAPPPGVELTQGQMEDLEESWHSTKLANVLIGVTHHAMFKSALTTLCGLEHEFTGDWSKLRGFPTCAVCVHQALAWDRLETIPFVIPDEWLRHIKWSV